MGNPLKNLLKIFSRTENNDSRDTKPFSISQSDGAENEGPSVFMQLQAQIEEAEIKGEPIAQFVEAQIRLLEKSHDKFVAHALAEGYSLSDIRIVEIEVQQYSAMKQLALKIGASTEKYDNLIRQSRIRVFGEENYKRFFESSE